MAELKRYQYRKQVRIRILGAVQVEIVALVRVDTPLFKTLPPTEIMCISLTGHQARYLSFLISTYRINVTMILGTRLTFGMKPILVGIRLGTHRLKPPFDKT